MHVNDDDPIDRLYQRLLILRCQTADERAFAELVARYHARLARFLRKMLDDDQHAADDVLQDVWMDVWRRIGALRDPQAFEAWLWRIARDRAYRILRRRGVRVAEIEAAGEVIAPAAQAGGEVDADERDCLRGSLHRLPHAQREVLLLRFVEELSYEQIADAVGCEIGTVRSRLFYAKRALRDLITEGNGHDHRS
jgi:RNA polymerase sigma-70 factor (ECF subfamily)